MSAFTSIGGCGALAAALVTTAPAQTPQTLAQIPVYPSSMRDADAEAAWREERKVGEDTIDVSLGGKGIVSSQFRAFRVKVAVDDVVKFYRQRLAAREAPPGDDDLYDDETGKLRLKTGVTSPVTLELAPVSFEQQADSRLESQYYAARPKEEIVRKLRAIYTKVRTPYQPGRWISGGEFSWARRDGADRITVFRVSVIDLGDLDLDASKLGNDTSIKIEIEERSESGEGGGP